MNIADRLGKELLFAIVSQVACNGHEILGLFFLSNDKGSRRPE
jgi:hypothetical protein